MSTHSITQVRDHGTPILTFYRQCDGYPSGHGADLAKFTASITLVNGFSSSQRSLVAYYEHYPQACLHSAVAEGFANGAGCYAAQLLTFFKTNHGIGGIYCTRADDRQEYNYVIDFTDPGFRFIVTKAGRELFNGDLKAFATFTGGTKDEAAA